MNFKRTIAVLKREIRSTKKHRDHWIDRDPAAAKRDDKFISEMQQAIYVLEYCDIAVRRLGQEVLNFTTINEV